MTNKLSFVNFLYKLCDPHLLLMRSSPDKLQGIHDLIFMTVGQVLLLQLDDELGGGKRDVLGEHKRFLHFGF